MTVNYEGAVYIALLQKPQCTKNYIGSDFFAKGAIKHFWA